MMTNFQVLKVLDIFSGLFHICGVDYRVMRRILQVKLTLDARRTPTILQSRRTKKQKKERNEFLASLWQYALMGLISLLFILSGGRNYFYSMSLTFLVILFIIMTTMITEFSSVLLDIRDKAVLGTKPVSGRTINTAKIIHIIIYMFFITASTAGIPLITSLLIKGPIFFLIFLCGLFLSDILIVFITALMYFMIIQFFGGEKVKDIINYVQIGFSIIIAVGYQVVGHSFDLSKVQMTFNPAWWQIFLPPLWYGAPFDVILNGSRSGVLLIFTLIGLILPLILLSGYIRLMPAFERNLDKLSEQSTGRKRSMKEGLIARIFCADKTERTFYRFSVEMMRSERMFKLKVYPSLGFSIALPFILLFNVLRTHSLAYFPDTKWYLTVYFSFTVIPMCVKMIGYSNNYKGAWVFYTSPLKDPTPFFKGAMKAFFIKLFLPIYFIQSLAFIALFGWEVVPQLLIVVLSAFFYLFICFKIFGLKLPFTHAFEGAADNIGLKAMPLLFLISIFSGLHLLATTVPYGIFIYPGILIAVNAVLWGKMMHVSWLKVQ